MFLEIYEACPSNLSAKKGFTKPMSIIGKISRAGTWNACHKSDRARHFGEQK